MTTPPLNPDPFATPTTPATPAAPVQPTQAAQPQAQYPAQTGGPYPAQAGVLYPGQPQPNAGWQPIQVRADNSLRTLSTWAVITTALTTAATFAAAAASGSMIDSLKDQLGSDLDSTPTLTAYDAVNGLSSLVQIASFVFLALWMSRLRSRQRSRGHNPGGVPHVEWWGWFVPLANLILPFLGMRSLTRRTVGIGTTLGWWLTYVAAQAVAGIGAVVAVFSSIDWSNGELAHPDRLDGLGTATWVSAIFMLVSWIFLARVIRTATAKDGTV